MSDHRNTLLVIIAVSMVSAIGGLVFNTMPLLLEAAKTAFELTPKQLGILPFFAGGGYLLGTFSGPFWVDKVSWKRAAFLIWVFAVAAFLFASTTSGNMLFFAFAMFGFACSLAIALAMRVLADMPDPEQAYGTRLTVELWSIAAFSLLFPVVFIARGGFSGAMFGLAAFAGILGLGALLMPKNTVEVSSVERVKYPTLEKAGRAWAILGIFLMYLLANVGLFYFLAVIAGDFDPTAAQFGLMFGVLKWLGGGAAAIGAIIGIKVGLKAPHYIAMLILLVGVLGLFLSNNMMSFMVSSWVWEFGFTLGCLFMTTAITRCDPSKKLVVLVPMAFGISMMAGGPLAGQLLESGSPNGLYALVAVCSLFPSAYILLAKSKTEGLV